MNKRMATLIISGILFTTQIYAGERIVSCSEPIVNEFYPVGDTSGNSVYTKRDSYRDCNVTETVQGACIKWENDAGLANIPNEVYSTYDESNYEDTMGEFFSALNAYDQIDHLWSGFSGYCVSGTLRDFSWASDPMFWGSIAMGYLMAGGGGDSATASFKSVGSKVISENAARETANTAVEETMKSMTENGVNIFTDEASAAIESAVISATQEAAVAMGKCLVSGTVNFANSLVDYINYSKASDDVDCNPIDEICGDSENMEPSTSDIKTIDRQEFLDLRDNYAEQGEDIEDYIDIIDEGLSTGIVSYKFKSNSDLSNGTESMQGANEIAEKLAKVKAIISGAAAVGSMATCMYTGGTYGTSVSVNTQSDSQRGLIQTGLNAGIDLAAKFIPGGPAVAAIAKVVVATAMSYQSVNSCDDSDDAKKMGSRHTKTYKSLQFNLCRPMWDTCEDEFFWGSCALQGYHYCCYDQLLTKVLVIQIKAQFGREWTNCTGISLSDLSNVSFRQCTDAEMQDGIDGAHAYGISINPNRSSGVGVSGYEGPIWDPTQAFQYKHKCLDLTEFKDFLSAQIGEDIDPESFNNYWDDVTDSDNNSMF